MKNNSQSPRITREKKTVVCMIEIYCRSFHSSSNSLCPECQELLNYANSRLDRCPFQEKKPTCAKCKIHCYEKGMREKIRKVMRFSGPRMIFKHPILAIRHLMDGMFSKNL